jgi:hypothetical protein
MISILDRGHPVGVAGADHIFRAGSVARQANSQTGVALLIEIFAHPAHLFRRAGETMDQQAAGLARLAGEEEGFGSWDDLGFGLHHVTRHSCRF